MPSREQNRLWDSRTARIIDTIMCLMAGAGFVILAIGSAVGTGPSL